MNNITDYNILEHHDPDVLAQMVTDAIDDGWQPYGSLQYNFQFEGYDASNFVQAVVKYKDLLTFHVGEQK